MTKKTGGLLPKGSSREQKEALVVDIRRAHALALVERTTQAQGLPFHLADPTVIEELAAIMRPQAGDAVERGTQ
jgi:hypothetical protein